MAAPDLRDDEVQLRVAVQNWIEQTIRSTGKPPEPVVIATVVGNVQLSAEPIGEVTGDDDATVRFGLLEME